MKSLYLQIEFIDKKLLPIFGISCVTDYENKIYIDEKEQHNNNINLEQLNELITEFREVFNSKNFSLHKSNYKINGPKQAINLLKTCLVITSIPHDIGLVGGKKILRLISKNNTLEEYINNQKYNKMSENRNLSDNKLVNSNIYTEILNPTQSVKKEIKQILTQYELAEQIKKTHYFEYILDPSKLISIFTNEFNKKNDIMKINLKKYFGNKSINCLKLEFKSKQYDGIDIVSPNFLQHFTKNITYDLCISSTRVYVNTIGNDTIDNDMNTTSNCKNLLISNIIIPLKSLYYHNVIINLHDFDEIKSLLNNLELKMCGSYVDFYTETENKLNKIPFEFNLEHNNLFNKLRIMHGMAGLAFSSWQTENDFLKIMKQYPPNNQNQQQLDKPQPSVTEQNKQNMPLEIKIQGLSKKFWDYEGFEFKAKPANDIMTFTPFFHKYDFSSYNDNKQIDNNTMTFFKSVDNNKQNNKQNQKQTYHYNLDLNNSTIGDLSCDSISNLEIFFKNINKLNSMYPVISFLKIYPITDDILVSDAELTYYVGSNLNSNSSSNSSSNSNSTNSLVITSQLISINLEPNQHINLISGNKFYGLSLVFEFNQNNSFEQNIFEEIISDLDIIVFYKKYFWDTPIRTKMAKKSNIIIDFNELDQNDNLNQNDISNQTNNLMKQMIPLNV
jgi:hypothetical protein